jgi:acetamidase/formamidase
VTPQDTDKNAKVHRFLSFLSSSGSRPVVETGDEGMTTGEGETMEAATNMAIEAMADLLMDQLDIDDTDAAMLIASAADVRAGLAGHAPYTMRVSVPKSMLSW